MDSGCGRSSAGPELAQQLGYKIEETQQSKKGHYFLGPGGEKYMNRGQVSLNARNEKDKPCITRFNIAEGIDQALGSVAEMNDAGNLVVFDSETSASIPGNSPEAASIRKAIARSLQKTEIHRRKMSFYIPLWVQPESQSSERATPFQGQGSRT